MTITKINYEQLFPNPFVQFGNIRFNLEIILQEGDTIADAFTRGHKEANDNFNRLFPQVVQLEQPSFYDAPRQPVIKDEYGQWAFINSKQSAEQRMINAINSCTEIKTLETYKLLVKNTPVFQDAYNKKMEELTK